MNKTNQKKGEKEITHVIYLFSFIATIGAFSPSIFMKFCTHTHTHTHTHRDRDTDTFTITGSKSFQFVT